MKRVLKYIVALIIVSLLVAIADLIVAVIGYALNIDADFIGFLCCMVSVMIGWIGYDYAEPYLK